LIDAGFERKTAFVAGFYDMFYGGEGHFFEFGAEEKGFLQK